MFLQFEFKVIKEVVLRVEGRDASLPTESICCAEVSLSNRKRSASLSLTLHFHISAEEGDCMTNLLVRGVDAVSEEIVYLSHECVFF